MAERIVIKVPTLGESVVDATIARIIKQKGDFVAADEPILELETDKVTLEVFAPENGTIQEIVVKEGDTVNVGADLAFMEAGSAADNLTVTKETPQAAAKAHEETPQPELQQKVDSAVVSSPKAAGDMSKSGPATQKAAAELGLTNVDAPGSGKDGRVTKADIIGALKSQLASQGASPSHKAHSQANHVTTERTEERIPLSRLRQRIAERLKEAQNTAAILTTFNEVDMSAIMNLRKLYKDSFTKKYGAKLGFMSFFVKACVEALKAQPMVNSFIDGTDIVQRNFCDIGVAVSAPQGLVVPVIRDAQNLSFADIEQAIVEYGQKAQEGKITIDDMTGGSFTISNGGTFGSMLSTPIINPPQSAILGMHSIQERAVVVDGQIVIRPMMYLALSYDHRLIDGREAVTFLVTIKQFLENPGRFALGV